MKRAAIRVAALFTQQPYCGNRAIAIGASMGEYILRDIVPHPDRRVSESAERAQACDADEGEN